MIGRRFPVTGKRSRRPGILPNDQEKIPGDWESSPDGRESLQPPWLPEVRAGEDAGAPSRYARSWVGDAEDSVPHPTPGKNLIPGDELDLSALQLGPSSLRLVHPKPLQQGISSAFKAFCERAYQLQSGIGFELHGFGFDLGKFHEWHLLKEL
jgi:hypothetical protein